MRFEARTASEKSAAIHFLNDFLAQIWPIAYRGVISLVGNLAPTTVGMDIVSMLYSGEPVATSYRPGLPLC